MSLRDSHPVLAEAIALLASSDAFALPKDLRARLERSLSLRPESQRQAGIRNIVRLARFIEHDLGAPEPARQLLDAVADLSFTDAELRAALKQAGERLSAAVSRLRTEAPRPATLRADQFGAPMRG